LAIRLAVDEPFLQEWWKLPDLPYSSLGAMPARRTVVPARLFDVSPELAETIAKATETWRQVQEAFKPCGELPDGECLLVNDWD
jgi:hypothetical protein